MPRGCLQFVTVVFPDHTHLLFLSYSKGRNLHPLFVFLNLLSDILKETTASAIRLKERVLHQMSDRETLASPV